MQGKLTHKQHILVVEDESIFRNSLKALLESASYKVTVAADGMIAKNVVMMQEFDCVLSDINMPGLSGLALLKFIKETRPRLPVILMTGFAVLDETREADKMGASGFIPKPFQKADLMSIFERLFAVKTPVPAAKPKAISESDQYSRVSIDEFVSGRAIMYDIYIKLSEEKFIKIATSGEDLPISRIRVYKAKGLSHLYLQKKDYQKYLELNVTLAKTISGSSKIPQDKKIHFLKHANDVVMEQLYFGEVDKEVFAGAKTVLDATLSVCSNDEQCLGLLESLNAHGNLLYAHSLGVSMYGVIIAKAMGWESTSTLHKIALGGLFHDIGKKELDPSILSKPRKDFTPSEVQAYETHVVRGVEILQSITTVPEDVLQIVLQHHEDCLGTGFPVKLEKHQIHPMAKLMAVADQFCNLSIRTTSAEPMDPISAIRRLLKLKSAILDAASLSALAKAFNIDLVVTTQEK